MTMHFYNLIIQKAVTQVQDQLGLHSKFVSSQDYVMKL